MTASNAFGRQSVVPLTNKSGGSVAAGDVVYLSDGTNADSFTTGTTSARTGGVGVVLDASIANNAAGRVLVAGYAPLVNVNASVTIGHFGQTYTVAKQATDAGSSRGAGTFCVFLTGGTTPDAILWQPDLGGGSGMTNPMTTTGDIIYSSSGSTPARLAVGSTNQRLVVASGLPSWRDLTSYLGYNTIGGTVGAITKWKHYTKAVTPSTDGIILSVGVYVRGVSSQATNIRVGVWADNSGAPGILLAFGGVTNGATGLYLQSAVATGTPRWLDIPCTTAVTGGTQYWIGFSTGDTNASPVNIYNDASGSDQVWTSTIDDLTDGGSVFAISNSTLKYSLRALFMS